METRALPKSDDWQGPSSSCAFTSFRSNTAYCSRTTNNVMRVISEGEVTETGKKVFVAEDAYTGRLMMFFQGTQAPDWDPEDWKELPLKDWWSLWRRRNPEDKRLERMESHAALFDFSGQGPVLFNDADENVVVYEGDSGSLTKSPGEDSGWRKAYKRRKVENSKTSKRGSLFRLPSELRCLSPRRRKLLL